MKASKERHLLGQKHSLQIFGVIAFFCTFYVFGSCFRTLAVILVSDLGLVEFSVVVRSFLAVTVSTDISPMRPEDSPTPLSREFF